MMCGRADFKTRELREIAVVQIAEKLGTSNMFYTNIKTCAYAMPKLSQTATAMLVTIEVPNIIFI